MSEARPKAVLFVCNLNRVRSPMAAALAARLLGPSAYTDSCGLAPAEDVDPFAVAALAEVGIDLAEHRPKTFDAVARGAFDLIVCLTPEACARAETLGANLRAPVETWPTPDPTLAAGSRDQRMEAYREVRKVLERRLSQRFPRPST